MKGLLASLFFVSLFRSYFAYIPASPTNNSNDGAPGAPNATDVSSLNLHWFPSGSYMQNISYELVGNGSKGLSQGALVHFSEAFVNNSTDLTKTPWIALVSCDHNETSASQVDDIFTLARDRGAVGALLYSLYSYACVINPEYADPTTFDQVFDIFSTQSLTSSRLIEYQFGQLGSMNESFAKMYNDYNASRLNASYDMVHNSIQDGNVLTNGYLIASLVAFNATETSNFTLANNNGNSQSGKNEKRSTTALAMIVLYAITGCVSALFCIVIISGAVRAIRHPERYGPRARTGDNGGMLQSRARGLTRAILDTFPVVKFGSNDHADQPSLKDVEHADSSAPPLEMTSRMMEFKESQSQINNDNSSITAVRKEVDTAPRQDVVSASDQASTSFARRSPQDISRTSREDVVPDAIGRDTCPICIVDFEEGDDLRILPCEGHHRFHQQCVDPWLLELSSSCPICRHDFLALENMLSGEDEEDEEAPPLQGPTVGNTHSRRSGRFSRYVRSAIQRHRRRRDEQVVSAPPVPSINAMPT